MENCWRVEVGLVNRVIAHVVIASTLRITLVPPLDHDHSCLTHRVKDGSPSSKTRARSQSDEDGISTFLAHFGLLRQSHHLSLLTPFSYPRKTQSCCGPDARKIWLFIDCTMQYRDCNRLPVRSFNKATHGMLRDYILTATRVPRMKVVKERLER